MCVRAVDAVDVDEVEENEQPLEREQPEKETLRMWRSRGRLMDDLRLWLKLWPSTCMVTAVSGDLNQVGV